MKTRLITTSLINSIEWFTTAPNTIIKPEKGGDGKITWKQKSYNDLKSMLGRKKADFGVHAKIGIQIENEIYKNAKLPPKLQKNREKLSEIYDLLQDCQFQISKKKSILIDDNEFCLYGRFDALKNTGNEIVDLKTTSSYKKNKYLNTIQHEMYCAMEDNYNDFMYLVVELEKRDTDYLTILNKNMNFIPPIKDIKKEVFKVENRNALMESLVWRIKKNLGVLKQSKLFDLYISTFCQYESNPNKTKGLESF